MRKSACMLADSRTEQASRPGSQTPGGEDNQEAIVQSPVEATHGMVVQTQRWHPHCPPPQPCPRRQRSLQ